LAVLGAESPAEEAQAGDGKIQATNIKQRVKYCLVFFGLNFLYFFDIVKVEIRREIAL